MCLISFAKYFLMYLVILAEWLSLLQNQVIISQKTSLFQDNPSTCRCFALVCCYLKTPERLALS